MSQHLGPETRAIIEAINGLKPSKEKLNYQILTFDLAVARSAALGNDEIALPGWFDTLAVSRLTGEASVIINERTNGAIDLAYNKTINSPIRRLFLTNAAQPGEVLVLEIGGDASFYVGLGTARSATFPPWWVAVGFVANQVTTAAYEVLGVAINWVKRVKATIVLRETVGAQASYYEVQGSMDGVNWVMLCTDRLIAAGGIEYETLTDLWVYVRVRIRWVAAAGTVEGRLYYELLG